MANEISVKKLIAEIKTSDFMIDCAMPLGYVEGLPLLRRCNGETLLMIPYLKYQVTGKVDQTLVYPIRFVITVRVRDGRIMGYQDLLADARFGKVDFNQPIGLFRHEAIRGWNKQVYKDNKQLLYRLYDEACEAMDAETVPAALAEQLGQLLRQMVEPCQLPIYQALDAAFYNTYMV
ncbi:MAG: hypothetical protein E7466_02795 [Ruminococcaceae bacterium]|nr:hypothetical protein [Oscillospiraceae bacterium]MBQ3215240.1 hypothetical protein [Oscillospiraceae bacterium]